MTYWKNPSLRPLPALVLLLLGLLLHAAFGPAAPSPDVRREGLVELACWISLLGMTTYWCTLGLERQGLLHFGGHLAMRSPSGAEVAVAALLLRGLGLLAAYGGPWLLLYA
jgi:hypothetical protein